MNGEESISYGDLAVPLALARQLREAGMKPGDRVALFMLDHADLVLFTSLLWPRAGRIAVSTRAHGRRSSAHPCDYPPFAVIAESDFASAITTGMAPNAKLFLRQRHLRSWLQRSETSLCPVSAGRMIRPMGDNVRHDRTA